MSKAFRQAPSDIWGFDSGTLKGYYLNRGVWLFGNMLEAELQAAENSIRKRNGGKGSSEKFINSERLRILGKYLKEDIKRFREPGKAPSAINQPKEENLEETLGGGFFKFKTK